MLNSVVHEIFSANKYENANSTWHFHIYEQRNFHAQLCLTRKNLAIVSNMGLISKTNFMLSWVEYEISLITSEPGHITKRRAKQQVPSSPNEVITKLDKTDQTQEHIKSEPQLAFYVNLHRAVIGPSATLTGRWRPDIDLRRMLTGNPTATKDILTYF